MAEMNFLILSLVILIINKDVTSGDEESRNLKLSLPEELSNEFRLKETILDILRRKLGFPVQKCTPDEKDREKQNLNTKSQEVHILLLQSNSKQKEDDQIENLKLTGDFNLGEFGHLTYNKDESKLDKDQPAAHAKSMLNILRISEENDDTGKYWEENYKENQIKVVKSDREIGQIDGIRKAGLECNVIYYVNRKCKEGTYRFSGKCNLCECNESEWKCTDVICIKNNWLQDLRVDNSQRKLTGASIKMYKKKRNQATGCMPGDIIPAADNKDCPCKCVLPSVMVCEMCPAVKKMVSPRYHITTKAPGTEPVYDYHYD